MLARRVVAGQGKIDVITLIAIVLDRARSPATSTSFCLGRRLGRAFLVKHGAAGADHRGAPASTSRRFFDRHGGKTILIGRFVGLVRRDRAVLRRLVGDAAAALPALRRASAPGCGDRLRRCSATSSGRASTELARATREGRCSRSASSIVVRRRRSSGARALAARRATTARRCEAWLDARTSASPRSALAARWRARWRPCCAGSRGPARFVWDRFTPGRAGARAHDAAGGRRRRQLRVRGLGRCASASAAFADRRRRRVALADRAAHGRAGLDRQGRHARSARCRRSCRRSSVLDGGVLAVPARAVEAVALGGGLALTYVARARHQGRLRPPAAGARARRRRRLGLPVRPRRYAVAWVAVRGRARAARCRRCAVALRLRHGGDRRSSRASA